MVKGKAGMQMNLGMRDETRALLDRVAAMVRVEIMPMEAAYHAEIGKGDRWQYTARQAEILEGLKARAKAEGLWNGAHADGRGGVPTATRPIPATWRCLSVTGPRR